MATKLTLSATAREIINALRQNKMIISHFVETEDGGIENYAPFTQIAFLESDEAGFLNIGFGNGIFGVNNLDDYPYYIISNDNPNLA